jgi:hypothetical protein
VVHGAPSRFNDPARFSFAHGGKDRHPFPVPLKTYDESIDFLRTSLDRARLGGDEKGDKLDGFRRLERFVRAVETRREPEADFEKLIAHENAISPSLDGRSVFDDKPRRKPRSNDHTTKPRHKDNAKRDFESGPRQRSLF